MDPRIEQGQFVGRPRIDTIWKNRRVRAVGSRICFRPPEEPFHQFLVEGLLSEALGEAWLREQLALPPSERHPVAQWIGHMAELMADWPPPGARQESEAIWSFLPDGVVQCLVVLAWDLYSLQHTNGIPESVMNRLRHPDQFQGARYEIAIGAIFARLGFTLEWAEPTGAPIPEFTAVNQRTGERIAVEAKSRHRPGALGHPGEPPDELAALRAGVEQPIRRALPKAPGDKPFVVFVDLNLPPRQRRMARL